MQIKFISESNTFSDSVVVGVYQGKVLSPSAELLDQHTSGTLSRALKANHFKGAVGEVFAIPSPAGLEGVVRIILVGLGQAEELSEIACQKAGAAAQVLLSRTPDSSVTFYADACERSAMKGAEVAVNMAIGVSLRNWRFDTYKTKSSTEELSHLVSATIVTAEAQEAAELFEVESAVVEGVKLTRTLVSEPPNALYPEAMTKEILELKKMGLEVEVLGEKAMRKLGMNSLLGVAEGSVKEPQLIIIEWHGATDPSEKPIAFVGKGVTFDSGGLSLKPPKSMETMKYDMAGSATVAGVMRALAGRNAPVNAVGVLGMVENMPSGHALRPGDILTSMSGQTIEVLNTDAEGRLVLADALWYTQDRFKPHTMIDLATLTGAIVVALGGEHAGLFANNDELAEKLYKTSEMVDERVWRLPLSDVYDRDIDSDIADVCNIQKTAGAAGSITAAQFLQRFVNNTKWAHIDIAGVADSGKDRALCGKGATGFGVRLLDRYVREFVEK